jgi:16S rRNA (uracil1498-N3)-methyltransferase
VFRVRVAVEDPVPARIRVEGPAFHHLRVARVVPREVVEVFDGRGRAWAAQVESVGEDHAVLALGEARTEDPGRRVLLLQGLPKAEKLDWVLQKTTELGVSAVWPLALARSVVKLGADVARKRQARWDRCGRSRRHWPHCRRASSCWCSTRRSGRGSSPTPHRTTGVPWRWWWGRREGWSGRRWTRSAAPVARP